MRSAFILFSADPPRSGGGMARFDLLAYVGKSADHQIVSPADLPTKLTRPANVIDRLFSSHPMLPTQKGARVF